MNVSPRLPGLLAITVLLLVGTAAAARQGSVFGQWLTDDNEGVLRIEHCGADLCGRIVGVTPDRRTHQVPVDFAGRPQCGEVIITADRRDGDGTWHGYVLNPLTGDRYHAELWETPSGHLKLRGYVGLPLFGGTRTWPRFKGTLGPACRFTLTSPG